MLQHLYQLMPPSDIPTSRRKNKPSHTYLCHANVKSGSILGFLCGCINPQTALAFLEGNLMVGLGNQRVKETMCMKRTVRDFRCAVPCAKSNMYERSICCCCAKTGKYNNYTAQFKT
jgi:hypothetical protein